MTTLLAVLVFGLAYFFPSIVAWGRKNHAGAIFALNLLLGWTGVAWVVALVMALWSNNAKTAPPMEGEAA